MTDEITKLAKECGIYKVYKPTANLGREIVDSLNNNVVPWVFDQDKSSGYCASLNVVLVRDLEAFYRAAFNVGLEAGAAIGETL